MIIEKIYNKLGLKWALDGTGYWDIIEALSFKYLIKKDKPVAMTSEEWSRYNKDMKSNHPIYVWIFDTMPWFMKRIFVNPLDRFSEFLYYSRHDWNNTIRIKTLHKGWNDCHYILEHGMFAVLNEYVERECASMNFNFNANKETKPWSKKLRELPFARYILSPYRSREEGLNHIQEMISIKDEDGNSISHQVEKYTEIRDIYLWWNDIYPKRPDVYEISGWSAICELKRKNEDGILGKMTDTERDDTHIALDKMQKIEQQYRDEDESMMIRLVKIRDTLWT